MSIQERTLLHVPAAMCEAYDYAKPAAFSRGMDVQISGTRMVFVSGTASVGSDGVSMHMGDFRRQARRAFQNVRSVLQAAGADWSDVVKVTIYIRDIAANYDAFNEIRCRYFREVGLDHYPASTCVEAKLCREELLVEMDAVAVVDDGYQDSL